MIWLLVPAILCAVCSFLVTRGTDGGLLLAFFLFGLLGGIYWGVLLKFREQLKFSARAVICFVSVIATIVGYSIDARLDEMAGMLYFLLPALLIVAFVAGEIFLWLLRILSLCQKDTKTFQEEPSEPK